MKKSSCQKLKEENKKLLKDIYAIVMQPLTLKSIETELRYKMKFDLEDIIMSGSHTITKLKL